MRWDGKTLVAAVEVGPQLAITTEAGGRTVSGSELPLSLVVSLMTQYGLSIDIDVIEAGCHVPPGTAYRTVYSQFVGPRHAVGERRTWLVLRLNSFDNLDRIIERGPSRTAGPKRRWRPRRISGRAAPAAGADPGARAVGGRSRRDGGRAVGPGRAVDNQEKWSYIRSGPNFITTYVEQPRAARPRPGWIAGGPGAPRKP